MTEMVRKADIHRMLMEALQAGDGDNPQLIPNLMGSLRLFTPTFEVKLTADQVKQAEDVAVTNLANTMSRIYS